MRCLGDVVELSGDAVLGDAVLGVVDRGDRPVAIVGARGLICKFVSAGEATDGTEPGCGDGAVAKELPERGVVACEPSGNKNSHSWSRTGALSEMRECGRSSSSSSPGRGNEPTNGLAVTVGRTGSVIPEKSPGRLLLSLPFCRGGRSSSGTE